MADTPTDDSPSPEDSALLAPERGGRRWITLIIKVALTGLMLFLVFRAIDFSRLGATLWRTDLLLLGLAVGGTVALNLIKPIRWKWLLQGVVPRASYGVALRSTLVAAGARLLLPSKLGEFGRVLAVPELGLMAGVGLTGLDLLMEVTMAFGLAIPGAVIFLGPAGAVIASGIFLLALFAVFHPDRILGPLARLPGLGRLRSRVDGARDVVRALGRGALVKGLAISVLLHVIRFVQLWILLLAVGTLAELTTILVLPLIQLADGFPLTIGGVGVREWLGVYLLPRFGVTAEAAVTAVFLQFAISNLLPGVVGWWLLFRSKSEAGQRIRRVLGGAWPDGQKSD